MPSSFDIRSCIAASKTTLLVPYEAHTILARTGVVDFGGPYAFDQTVGDSL
jgi:hypothetical protein